jgi:hypothetical protein
VCTMNHNYVDSNDIVDMDEHDGDLLAGMVVRVQNPPRTLLSYTH